MSYQIPTFRCLLVREHTQDKPVSDPPRIETPREAASMLRPMFEGLDREQFGVLLLDTRNHPIGWNVVSIGSLNSSIVHPREVFKPAILASAAAVILFHNHPSGDTEPSPEDVAVTRRIVSAGEIIGIRVLDHVILGTGDAFYSMEQHGHMG